MRWFLSFLFLLAPVATQAAEHWHEYGRCLYGSSTLDGTITPELTTTQTDQTSCVKSVSQLPNAFKLRLNTNQGKQHILDAYTEDDGNTIIMMFDGQAATQSIHRYWGVSECYVTGRDGGLDIMCFQGNGMPLDGLAPRPAAADPLSPNRWQDLPNPVKTVGSMSATATQIKRRTTRSHP